MVLDAVRECAPDLSDSIKPLKHSELVHRMQRASHFLTVPGLGAIYESLSSGTPTYFLPPTNLTQSLQLDCIADAIPTACDFCNLAPWRQLKTGSEESYISALFDIYSNTQSLGDAVAEDVLKAISSSHDRSCSRSAMGSDFINQMGGRGEEHALQHVREYLAIPNS